MNYKSRSEIKNLVIFLIIIGLILPNFAYLQSQGPPESLEEMKGLGDKALDVIRKFIPENFKKFWKEECLPIWQKIYNWFKKTVWDPYFGPFFKKEMEKRKPDIEEEFEKEKKEMKESAKKEVPKITKSLWQKLKELFK